MKQRETKTKLNISLRSFLQTTHSDPLFYLTTVEWRIVRILYIFFLIFKHEQTLIFKQSTNNNFQVENIDYYEYHITKHKIWTTEASESTRNRIRVGRGKWSLHHESWVLTTGWEVDLRVDWGGGASATQDFWSVVCVLLFQPDLNLMLVRLTACLSLRTSPGIFLLQRSYKKYFCQFGKYGTSRLLAMFHDVFCALYNSVILLLYYIYFL